MKVEYKVFNLVESTEFRSMNCLSASTQQRSWNRRWNYPDLNRNNGLVERSVRSKPFVGPEVELGSTIESSSKDKYIYEEFQPGNAIENRFIELSPVIG